MAKTTNTRSDSAANLGFEAKTWLSADKLRKSMHTTEYKHVDIADGTMSSNQSSEGDMRRALVKANVVNYMVALPDQTYYKTKIPVHICFLPQSKAADSKRGFRDRGQQTGLCDARKHGALTASHYNWREPNGAGQYEDMRSFSKSVSFQVIEVKRHSNN